MASTGHLTLDRVGPGVECEEEAEPGGLEQRDLAFEGLAGRLRPGLFARLRAGSPSIPSSGRPIFLGQRVVVLLRPQRPRRACGKSPTAWRDRLRCVPAALEIRPTLADQDLVARHARPRQQDDEADVGRFAATMGAIRPPSLWPMSPILLGSNSLRDLRNSTPASTSVAKSGSWPSPGSRSTPPRRGHPPAGRPRRDGSGSRPGRGTACGP